MATLTCPACAATVKPADLICFTCGANLPRGAWEEDAPAPATIMQEYLRREEQAGSISPSVLRLSFPTGNVEVPAGTSLLLGRDRKRRAGRTRSGPMTSCSIIVPMASSSSA